jgi:integrase
LSPRSINKLLINLHSLFRRAAQVYGLERNPAALVDRQPVCASGDFRVLTPAEVERLIAAAAHVSDAAVFAVAAFAGLRVGEIRALRWGDIDFGTSVIRVRRSYVLGRFDAPKSGRVRSVPLIPQVERRLLRLRERGHTVHESDLVFISPTGTPISDSRLRRRFYEALARAGIPHLRFHDLRHSFGTLAVQAFPLSDVAAFMGHADVSTTMIYVHHVPRADAAAKLASVVEASSPTS